jgi:DNA invertase Pin-like site-specific DNA recombinase
MTIYGYARVSTDGETLEGQIAQLREAGCTRVFQEKLSGAKLSDRKALQRVLDALGEGDVLLATKLDRVARSTQDFLNIIGRIVKQGAFIRLLDQPIIDTTKTDSIAKAIMQLVAVFAELERSMIVSRMSEGRTRAMAKGIKFGPKFKLNPVQLEEAKRRRADGQSLVEIGEVLGVNYRTIGRALDRI